MSLPLTSDALTLNADALSRLDASIQSDIDQGKHFGASIIVAHRGVIQHRKCFGTVAPGRAAAPDDLYLMMSLSKSFTAALTLRAIDLGRYTLDTRVADFIPEFAAGGKQRVTVRQLLTHTAGTYASFVPPPPLAPSDLGQLARNVAAVSALPATNTPGERVVYNPFASYAVLGQLLVVTDPLKRSFRDIAREDLFEPLGMHQTCYGLSPDTPGRVPVAFTERNSNANTAQTAALLNLHLQEDSEHPAGGAFSTVDDVLLFAEALRPGGALSGKRLISPALQAYAAQNHTGNMGNGAWDAYREAHGLPEYPANFSLLGGYVRGSGHYINGAGFTASPETFYAVGGGSTMWWVDPIREITFVFLSAGFIEGLAHFERLCRLGDLVSASWTD
ncbi:MULTISPECIES: serine hydrolase domain-containing protein [unclassified Pseudomonas]|uniref:serine hydrolase domain-containing protein n=1 Tax=unclassified Pseudomonas TaxID=196821 RepID=UPI0025F24B49|nr:MULTISPECIES: serine hydrolase domain-containing protein [unclassified Pseudomonas]